MIRIFNPNLRPTLKEGQSHKEDFKVVGRPEPAIAYSFNICDWVNPYCEPKFAEVGAITDLNLNDQTDLLFQLSAPTDTVEISLYKCINGEEVFQTDITDDDLYGTFFPTTFFPDELKVGFLADWNAIINAFKSGTYVFKSNVTILNQNDPNLRSWFYHLEPFSIEAAQKTARIQSNQSGPIDGGIDYTGFIWFSEFRFYGRFGEWTPGLEKDHYQDQDRFDVQNRDRGTSRYTLKLQSIPFAPLRAFLFDRCLANDIFVQSYNPTGVLTPFQKFNVVPEEFGQPESNEDFVNTVNIDITYIDKAFKPVKTNK